MKTWYPRKNHFNRLSQLIGEPSHWRAGIGENQRVLDETGSFLARLKLLYGIPFQYLVPDSRMLPPESIRFFFVDQNWVDAIVDGALSLGRIAEVDQQHDRAVVPLLHARTDAAACNIRRTLLKKEPVGESGDPPNYTGFLMRSAVVSGWPGLEVAAYKDARGEQPVNMLRMDRVANQVLICIFEDLFESLNIHEPREGITFGADPAYSGKTAAHLNEDPIGYSKKLRGLGVNGYAAGEPIDGVSVEVPLRPGAPRVVSMADLKGRVLDELKGLDPPAWDDRDFTSAQFSVQLVQGASQFIFTNKTENAEATGDRVRRSKAKTRAARRFDREADLRRLNRFLFEEGDQP